MLLEKKERGNNGEGENEISSAGPFGSSACNNN